MQKNGIENVWSKDASESTVVPTSNKQIIFEEKTACKDQKSKKKCQLLKEKNGGKGCKKKSINGEEGPVLMPRCLKKRVFVKSIMSFKVSIQTKLLPYTNLYLEVLTKNRS